MAMYTGTNGGVLYPAMNVGSGQIKGITVLVSDSASDVVLVDASQCAAASDVAVLDASRNATLELSDAPTSSGALLHNMFQSNERAIKAELTFGFELLRSDAACVLTGVTA
jgi:hypothetical protein